MAARMAGFNSAMEAAIQPFSATAGLSHMKSPRCLERRHCLHHFPFSRLREKVPDRADEGVGPTATASIEWQTAALIALAKLGRSVKASAEGHPHPALRATFSRKREKGSLQQYPLNILICDSPA